MERSKSMNHISPTYPLHQSDDELLLQQAMSSSTQHQHHHHFQLNVRNPPIKRNKSQGHAQGRSSSSSPTTADPHKKIIHRDVERQRRHEMATLYELLRSLLPPEYLKGKRSISDHMYEAANYIKHLKNKIKEMDQKRENLRILSNSIAPDVGQGSYSVVCRPCWSGVEVIICTSLRDGMVMPLSRFLSVLIEEGFNVISCVSITSNETLIHTLQAEVSNLATVDTSGLQQKLMDVVNQVQTPRQAYVYRSLQAQGRVRSKSECIQ